MKIMRKKCIIMYLCFYVRVKYYHKTNLGTKMVVLYNNNKIVNLIIIIIKRHRN